MCVCACVCVFPASSVGREQMKLFLSCTLIAVVFLLPPPDSVTSAPIKRCDVYKNVTFKPICYCGIPDVRTLTLSSGFESCDVSQYRSSELWLAVSAKSIYGVLF